MKKTALFLYLLMAHLALFGQKLPDNTQVKWGNEQKFNKKMTLSEVTAQDETGYYIIKRKLLQEVRDSQKLPFLEKFDKNLNLQRSVDLSKFKLAGKPKFEKLVSWNNQMWLFYSADISEKQGKGLYRVAIDKKNLNPIGESHFVMSTERKSALPMLRPGLGIGLAILKPIFHIYTAEDQGKLLVVHEDPKTENNQKEINVLIMDTEFNTLSKVDEKIQAQDKYSTLVNAILDSDGNVHMLSNDRLNLMSTFQNTTSIFTLISIPNNSDQALHRTIDLGELRITDANIQADKDGHLYFGGFYSTTRSKQTSGGTYFLKIDGNNQQVLNQKVEEFEASFLTSSLKNSKANKISKKLSDGKTVEDAMFFLDEIIIKDDGSVAFVGEDRSETLEVTRSVGAPGSSMGSGTRRSETYSYGNIVVAEFETDGTRKWTKKVAKDQFSRDDAGFFFSYSVSMINNQLYFIFNDNEKNIAYKGQGKVETFSPKSLKNPVISFVKLDKDGTISRSSLSMQNNKNLMTITPVNTQTGPHEIVIYGLRKKTYRLAKLTFDPNMMASE